MAAYAIQFRRGTTTEHNSFTGLLGEVTVDTTKKTIVVHDGSNAGGSALALEGAATNTTTGTFSSNVTIGGTLSVAGNLTMTGHILPSANVTYDLGSSSMMWKDIYVGPGSLYVNGKKVIEDDSGAINITTDNNGDLKMTTTGTGTLKLISANGINLTGELGATSGDLQIGDHIDMNSSLIKELGTPVSSTDAANKAYVDTTSASAVTGGANALSVTTGAFSGNVTMAGNLTVSGTTTTINTAQINIADNIIVLNSDATGTATINAGFEIERGDDANKQFLWDETNNRWSVGSEDMAADAFLGDLTGNVTGNVTGDITGDITGNLTGNSAGVHTGAVTGDVTGGVTGNLIGNVTGNLTGNSAGVHTGAVTGDVTGNTSGSAGTVTSIAAHLLDEDNMASNSATKVASQQSVKAYVDAQILTEDNTDEIVEGSTNLYYTDARARAAISATGSLAYNSTTGVISFTMNDETVEDIVGGMLTGNTETGITVTYEDSDGTIDFVVASQTDENFTTADHAKLDGIEASATADQTDAEIRAGVEAASDSNVFTDADHSKLNAIESTADVTDGTNVTAAGALMDSEVTNLAAVKAFDTTDYATAAQGSTANAALPKAGGAMTGAITTNSTFDGRDVASDGSKLDGIESGATADQTAAQLMTAIKTVDGAGSGLDADLLDGNSSAYFTGYADTAEADAISTAASTAESKDATRASAANAYADTAEADAITTAAATAESKDATRASAANAYADAAITALVDGAPATLNTLNELAAALADDASHATTLTNLVGTKLALAGGAMTGAITTNSTFDGRNVSVDGAKLDGIASSANNYSHPGYAGDDFSLDTGALSGATVVSDIDINVTTDGSGHVTDANGTVSTRTLTLADLGHVATTFQVEDGDGTEVTISHGKEWKFVEGNGMNINWSDTTPGSDADPFDLTFEMDGQYTGDFTVSGDITAQGGDVTATRFNGTATYALYADLAERYAADAPYEEGTVVMFGGEAEVTSAQGYGSTKIAGVVSTKPAFAMNEAAGNSETHPYIALQGRVPCKVMGTVSKGDMLVASEVSGIATAWTDSTTDPRMTAYVGIAIEDKTTDAVGYIEVKVGK